MENNRYVINEDSNDTIKMKNSFHLICFITDLKHDVNLNVNNVLKDLNLFNNKLIRKNDALKDALAMLNKRHEIINELNKTIDNLNRKIQILHNNSIKLQ